MLVTDQVLLGVPLVGELVEGLGQHFQVCVFEDGKAEPAIDVAEKAIRQAASHGCDSIVGIGGGSNLDVAKVVACVMKHGGEPRDYFGVRLRTRSSSANVRDADYGGHGE